MNEFQSESDEMSDSGGLGSGDQDTYAEDRSRRLRRRSLLGFAVCFAIWVLGVVPLARDSIDEREGASVVAFYLPSALDPPR
jgi:hypothetical protein